MSGLELVATLGAAQGILLLALIGCRYRRVENVPLAILLLVFSVRMGTIPLWNPVSMAEYPWLLPATTPLPFLFGPLIWWYAHELSNDSGVRTKPTVLLHFLPYILDVLFTVILVVVGTPEQYREMIGRIFAGDPPLHLLIRNGAKVVVNVGYTGLAIWRAFRRTPAAEITVRQKMWLRWLVLTPVASLTLFGFVALYPAASAGVSGGASGPFTLLAGAMAALIYVFSALILIAPEVPSGHTIGRGRGRRASGHFKDDPKSELGLHDACDRLASYLSTAALRDADLSLDAAAAAIGVHPNLLSHAINELCGSSFPAYVNRRRVEFFIEQANTGVLSKRTILDLAFDAGFSSKSTFNRVFREVTGRSPSQFLREGSLARASVSAGQIASRKGNGS